MKGYRKVSGVYLEVSDTVPVSSSCTQVALRPSTSHTFTDTWASDPLNVAVCWRLKTVAEQNAELDGDLQVFLDSAGGRAVKTLALVGIDKGVWSLAELRAKYRLL